MRYHHYYFCFQFVANLFYIDCFKFLVSGKRDICFSFILNMCFINNFCFFKFIVKLRIFFSIDSFASSSWQGRSVVFSLFIFDRMPLLELIFSEYNFRQWQSRILIFRRNYFSSKNLHIWWIFIQNGRFRNYVDVI